MSKETIHCLIEDIQIPFKLRMLTNKDKLQVQVLDELSGNNLSDLLDDESSIVYGSIRDGKLIGYCTVGGVEGTEHQSHAESIGEIDTSRTISDVFIHPYCRRLGIGTAMIETLVREMDLIDSSVCRFYCTVLDSKLEGFYKNLGFRRTATDGILTCIR